MNYTYKKIKVKPLKEAYLVDPLFPLEVNELLNAYANLTITTKVYDNGDAHLSGAFHLTPNEYEVV